MTASLVNRRVELLRRIPLFESLAEIGLAGDRRATPSAGAPGAPELVRLARRCREISLPRGKVVCRAGDEGDALYLVISGELEVWSADKEPKVISRLGPGEFFGEIALLTGSPRSATVSVAHHAELLVLDRAAFNAELVGNPRVLHTLSTHLARRLARSARGEVMPRRTTLLAVIGPPQLEGRTLAAYALAGLLEKLTGRPALYAALHLRSARGVGRPGAVDLAKSTPGSHIVTRAGQPATLVVELDRARGRERNRALLLTALEQLVSRVSYIVLDVGPDVVRLLPNLAGEVDVAVRVTDDPSAATAHPAAAGDATRVFDLVDCSHRPCTLPVNHLEPFVLPAAPALETLELQDQWDYLRDHPLAPVSRPLYRLARKILGTSVGVAFGGGAAFGVAHIGVVKVLEEHGIPIDVVAGTSMGSAIAISYAAGMSGAAMEEIAREHGNWWATVSHSLDFTLLQPGFFTGEHLLQGLRPLFNGLGTFDQLLVPCRTVATDIESGERVTLASGELEIACRASCSVPMVWTPVVVDGRVLVDGGIADPVPAEVVREMGADLCIAINVVPLPKKGVENVLSRGVRQARNALLFGGLLGTKDLPNLFDVVMNSIQVLQYELGHYRAISADVRINPALADFTWIEFYRATEIAARGDAAARARIHDIERVLAQRLARSVAAAPAGSVVAARTSAARALGA